MKTWKSNLEETKQRYINWWNHFCDKSFAGTGGTISACGCTPSWKCPYMCVKMP